MKKNPLVMILGISTAFFIVFMIVVGVVMNTKFSGSGSAKQKLFSKSNHVGVIELNGGIMDSKKYLEYIDSFEDDPMIKAVLVRINSPGGAVGPSQEIYEGVKRLAKKKPTYASIAGIAASGGYYVAVGAKKIYSNPGAMTGSIGVIMQFSDMSKLFQWAKMSPYNIKTGKFKDIGNPAREMTADERELLQNMAMNVLGQFRRAVAEGRNLPMEKVVEVSDGRIFSGEQAKNLKLVDELGGFNEALEAVAKEAGITGKPVAVYAHKKRALLEKILMGDGDDAESESRLSQFVKVLTKAIVKGATEATVADTSSGGLMFMLPNHGNE